MNLLAAIALFVLGILLITVWASIHIILHVLGWILVIGAAVWLLYYLFGRKSRVP